MTRKMDEGCRAEVNGEAVTKAGFTYVYILQSLVFAEKFYTGMTKDLQQRLLKHNEGGVPYTSRWKPWRIHCAFAFTKEDCATRFEKYLKSGSGRAFAKRHFE